MRIDSQVLLAILAMAAVTYATRVSGLWLIGRVTLSSRMEAALGYLPGTVLIAIVAPVVLTGGIAEKVAALATVAVAVRSRSLLLAMVAGIAAVWLVRNLLSVGPT